MNIYVVVEGKTEGKVYRRWIPYVNPGITYAGASVFDMVANNFAITSGGGYPLYLDLVRDAIRDVNNWPGVDRLVIAADSEDMSRAEKRAELARFLRDDCPSCRVCIFVVVQHFCIETWALGNRRAGPRNPTTTKLRTYKEVFCVYENDPEQLPPYPPKYRIRAQFAVSYLRAMLNDRNPRLSYSKSRPSALYDRGYFNELRSRFEDVGHIASFGSFLRAFT